MTPPQIDARQLSAAEYKAAKANMTDWRQRPAKPAARSVREQLDAEIRAFEESGRTSVFSTTSSSTSNTSNPEPTPTPAVPANFTSATSMTDAQYQKARRDIANGKVPPLAASSSIHA